MALITRYINTASSAGGDGTTNATTGANRAYVSMNEWEAAEQTDLVTDADQHTVYGTGTDTTATIISGWTEDSTYFKTIDGSAGYAMNVTGTAILFGAGGKNTVFEQLEITATSVGINADSAGAGSSYLINRCNIHGCGSNGIKFGNSVTGTPRAVNTLLYDNGRAIYSTSTNNVFEAINCTAVDNGDYGILRCVTTNCISHGHTSGDYLQTGTGSNYCHSEDGSAPGANSVPSTTLTFINEAGNDFRLSSSDSAVYDDGIGSGTDSDVPTIDFYGTSRSTTAPSMGYFEYVSGDTTAPILSSPTGTATGSTTATGNVTSVNDANGNIYRYTSTSITPPSLANHKDGTSAAAWLDHTVTAEGAQTLAGITGLTASTTYYNHYLHVDAALNESNVVTSASFTTDAASLNVSATTHALTLTENVATISLDRNITTNTAALTLTENSATISLDYNVQANTDALSLVSYSAAIGLDKNVSANTDALSLATYSATIDLSGTTNVQAGTHALTLATYAANIETSGATNIQANTDALTLTTYQAGISLDYNVTSTTQALSLTSYQAAISIGYSVQAGTDSLTLTSYAAAIGLDRNVLASTQALTLTSYASDITGNLIVPDSEGLEYRHKSNRLHYRHVKNKIHYRHDANKLHYRAKKA